MLICGEILSKTLNDSQFLLKFITKHVVEINVLEIEAIFEHGGHDNVSSSRI